MLCTANPMTTTRIGSPLSASTARSARSAAWAADSPLIATSMAATVSSRAPSSSPSSTRSRIRAARSYIARRESTAKRAMLSMWPSMCRARAGSASGLAASARSSISTACIGSCMPTIAPSVRAA